MRNNEDTDKLHVINNEEWEEEEPKPSRTLHVFRLLLLILVIVIFAGLFLLLLQSLVSRAQYLLSSEQPAVVSTPEPTPSQQADFYHDDMSEESRADQNDLKQRADKKDDGKTELNKTATKREDLTLYQTYGNVTVNSGITISASASTGTIQVIATDQSGKQTVIFDKTAPFTNATVNTNLPSGTYALAVYTNATGWRWQYSTH